MPILNGQLDPDGQAFVDLLVWLPSPRINALRAAGQNIPPPKVARGIIDPGAAVTVIDLQCRQALNLAPFRIRRAAVPNMPAPINVWSYKIDLKIRLPSGLYLVRPMLSVFEMPLIQTGSDVLLGCDVLSQCQFIHNGSAGVFSLAF
jgi:hypothetical protein